MYTVNMQMVQLLKCFLMRPGKGSFRLNLTIADEVLIRPLRVNRKLDNKSLKVVSEDA